MGCSQCERMYRQNLEHIRILAAKCAELTESDQIIYKVNGRVWYYEFSEKARGEYVETVRFNGKPANIDVLPNNEKSGLVAVDSGEPLAKKRKPRKAQGNLVENIGGVLPSGKSKKVQGTSA